jgi:hypothetical protein
MTLDQLKSIFDEAYGFDIARKTRKRNYAYARKNYVYTAYKLHFTLAYIGTTLKCNHDLVHYHVNTIHSINDYDKLIFNKIVQKYDLGLETYEMKKYTYIGNFPELEQLTPEQIEHFRETRVKPYILMLKHHEKTNTPTAR